MIRMEVATLAFLSMASPVEMALSRARPLRMAPMPSDEGELGECQHNLHAND